MKELSLYTGCGGGLLGTLLLGFRPIGYVEIDEYCQRIIAQRIKDRILPIAPIFGDVRKFLESGSARQYRGVADVVTGGFPCQPFSIAGRRKGSDDSRNMWPETIEVIRQVRPRFCFLENVRGLLSSGYFQEILKDLAQSGYDVRWRVLSAAELGAPHKRDRLWIAAHSNREYGVGWSQSQQSISGRGQTRHQLSGSSANVSDSEIQQDRRLQQRGIQPDTGGSSAEIPYTNKSGLEGWESVRSNDGEEGQTLERSRDMGSKDMADTPSKGLEGKQRSQHEGTRVRLADSRWWETEPELGRLAHRIPNRVDRLKAAGNAQVPVVAAKAWEILTEGWY